MSKTMDDIVEKRKNTINSIGGIKVDQKEVWKMVSVEEILQKTKGGQNK